MTIKRKRPISPSNVRQHMETGPIVLLTSADDKGPHIMTMGWHMMLGFDPALIGCYIWEENESYKVIRRTRECVINIPTEDLLDKAVGVGNSHSSEVDKFETFGLTPRRAKIVKAPLIGECYANFECKLHNDALVRSHGLFIWKVVASHVAPIKNPKTIHYRGEGKFMIAGKERVRRSKLKPQNL